MLHFVEFGIAFMHSHLFSLSNFEAQSLNFALNSTAEFSHTSKESNVKLCGKSGIVQEEKIVSSHLLRFFKVSEIKKLYNDVSNLEKCLPAYFVFLSPLQVGADLFPPRADRRIL